MRKALPLKRRKGKAGRRFAYDFAFMRKLSNLPGGNESMTQYMVLDSTLADSSATVAEFGIVIDPKQEQREYLNTFIKCISCSKSF
jgi:hypothetical protein